MKRIFTLFTLLALIMAFPFNSLGKDRKVVDFNYPQDVSKEALADLNKAMKAGDGQETVDALVRYSIAQSSISQDNMPEIINQLENVIKKEKQPHIRALLYHFEAIVYKCYRNAFVRYRNRKSPVDETPTDVSEWNRGQFDEKIMELVARSMEDIESLKQVPVTSMSDILVYDELGAIYIPTLFEFLSMENLELLESAGIAQTLENIIKQRWLDATEGNVPAHIYAMTEVGETGDVEDYKKYQDSEYSALLLQELRYLDDKEEYQLLKDYVVRFPSSVFTPDIINEITKKEEKSVSLSFPGIRSTRDSIDVSMTVANTNAFDIAVYKVVEGWIEHDQDWSKIKVELVKTYPVKVQGNVPFRQYNVKLTLAPLPYGIYYLQPINLNKDEKFDTKKLNRSNFLRVTDMAMMAINRYDQNDKVGTVDVTSGKPIPGVTVNYLGRSTSGTLGSTKTDGMVAVPKTITDPDNRNGEILFTSMALQAIKGEDKFAQDMPYYKLEKSSTHFETGVIFTDLGVYRPGETVQWAAIAYYTTNEGRHALTDYELDVVFKDTNDKTIDKVRATTDAFGRIEGSFVVPKDRMNGQFSLVLTPAREGSRYNSIARKYVNVSEYKTPTFAVTFPDSRFNYVCGQPVKITGKAETYSGMPLANTQVRLSLIRNEWRWSWWYAPTDEGTHLMDTTVTTDAQGMFTFSFEPNLFSENKNNYGWSRYNYQVVATATSDAGETHEESMYFIVGMRRGIKLGSINKNVFLNDKPIKLPLEYNTTDEEHPNTYCTWEVYSVDDLTQPVKTGNLNTADPTIDLTDLPSGKYRLKVHILDAEEGEDDVDDETYITLYRNTDTEPPVKNTPLWISPLTGDVDKTNTAHITVGVSVPKAYIYYVAATSDKVISEGWLNYNKGLHDFTMPLPKEPGADVTVSFNSYYNTTLHSETKHLTNPYKAEETNISATSFRDKLSPGDIEHWTFSLTDQNGKPKRGAMLLDMYDKAIASIKSNNWSWSNWHRSGIAAELSAQGLSSSRYVSASWIGQMLDKNEKADPTLPYLYIYNTAPFGGRYAYVDDEAILGATSSRMLMKKNGAVEERYEASPMQAEMSDAAAAMGEDQPTVNEDNLNKVILRENDVKTALWQPMLTSDEKGNIKLEFEVPNFSTTWITQALAYNEELVGSTWMAEVLTQKPLMVRSNMPRFLRQGDKAQLAATVQNATDKAAKSDAVIELFDPRSGDIYATRNFNLELDPMGSQAVKIDWVVPDTISFVGFRIKAANGRYGDGEQVMVPVLTTISPVIETQPFYIDAGTAHYEETLPQFPADARVTLEYCDNPVWYCVLALPTIFSDSYSTSTQAAHSLYALQVAKVVSKMQPQIKEAINYWKEHNEDSALVSMLEKNPDLKISTLLASPWVRDADRQSLRMSKLHELFDDGISKREYEKILTALQSLQMSDGGFTWFRYPDCQSSIWATETVLQLIGEIKSLDGLPDDSRLTSMIERAVKYYDKKCIELYREAKEKHNSNPEGQFTGYAYTRNLFNSISMPKENTKLLKNVIKYIEKTWNKGISVKDKAWCAMTLNRNGKKKTAAKIVESIRQFAITKPNTGMYWDNLQTGYGWWELDKVAYTTTILRAMSEVDPRQDEIDQIRKWMLLMKQSNDWGSYSLAADAVHSILSTGSQWLERNPLPSISIAGQDISLDKMSEWLGYFRTTLDAATTGSVVIDRQGNGPAWGAIYSQYKSPMTEIKEKAIEEVSISKEYYVYAQDGSLHQATSFKVGDKVMVRLVIKTNRDMDYVSITDERASCFEPVDKLSGYRNEDRTWYYLETKDTQTNTFINDLRKGTHVIGYDVWVTNPGEFTSGIATIQSQYAPQLSAHSSGKSITVTEK